jgi:hypothetical protein
MKQSPIQAFPACFLHSSPWRVLHGSNFHDFFLSCFCTRRPSCFSCFLNLFACFFLFFSSYDFLDADAAGGFPSADAMILFYLDLIDPTCLTCSPVLDES